MLVTSASMNAKHITMIGKMCIIRQTWPQDLATSQPALRQKGDASDQHMPCSKRRKNQCTMFRGLWLKKKTSAKCVNYGTFQIARHSCIDASCLIQLWLKYDTSCGSVGHEKDNGWWWRCKLIVNNTNLGDHKIIATMVKLLYNTSDLATRFSNKPANPRLARRVTH